MKTVFLYAGQGSQRVGMGKDFYEKYDSFRNLVDELSGKEGLPDFKTLMFEGPMEELTKTEYTQGCMALFAAGVTKLLEEAGIQPAAACGLSLGEYGALYAAGCFDEKEYIRMVAFRGRVMAEASKGHDCCMSAILGMDSEKITEITGQYDGNGMVSVANYNCPGQTVICGDEIAVTTVEERLKAAGAKRCIRLQVGGPFHTKYMAPAGDALRIYFEKMEFKKPKITVAANAIGRILTEDDDIKHLLVRQVQRSVHLEKDLMALMAAGYTSFIEIGPGNTMAGFLKKTARAAGIKADVISIDTADDFEKVTERWKKQKTQS